jgi:hypothetical protein
MVASVYQFGLRCQKAADPGYRMRDRATEVDIFLTWDHRSRIRGQAGAGGGPVRGSRRPGGAIPHAATAIATASAATAIALAAIVTGEAGIARIPGPSETGICRSSRETCAQRNE